MKFTVQYFYINLFELFKLLQKLYFDKCYVRKAHIELQIILVFNAYMYIKYFILFL